MCTLLCAYVCIHSFFTKEEEKTIERNEGEKQQISV